MLAKQDSLHDIYFGQRETLIIHFDTSVTQVWHKCDASERLASPDFNELESKVNLNRLRWRRLVSPYLRLNKHLVGIEISDG